MTSSIVTFEQLVAGGTTLLLAAAIFAGNGAAAPTPVAPVVPEARAALPEDAQNVAEPIVPKDIIDEKRTEAGTLVNIRRDGKNVIIKKEDCQDPNGCGSNAYCTVM